MSQDQYIEGLLPYLHERSELLFDLGRRLNQLDDMVMLKLKVMPEEWEGLAFYQKLLFLNDSFEDDLEKDWFDAYTEYNSYFRVAIREYFWPLFDAIDLSHLPIKCKLQFKMIFKMLGVVEIFLKMPIIDVRDQRSNTIELSLGIFNDTQLPSLDEFADSVRKGIHTLMTHEVDEQILINGERRYDPH